MSFWIIPLIALIIGAASALIAILGGSILNEDEPDPHETMIYPDLESTMEELEETCEESRKYRESYND